MFERARRMIGQWRDQAAIRGMDDMALADLGVSRDQALHLAAMPEAVPKRMQAMAGIFGVDGMRLEDDRSGWIELAEICSGCRETVACRRTLDRARVLDGSVSSADCGFCPNAATFRDLAAAGA